MGKVCGSGCPYYGVDENYNGYCKKDHNSYRERFAPCNMESSSSPSSSSPATTSSSSVSTQPRTCTSSCPYYGVDANSNGYCKKDHNSYRERFATCNMGETTTSSGGSGSSSGSSGGSGCGGCFKWVLIILAVLVALIIGGNVLTGNQKSAESPAQNTTVQTASTTAEINLRKGPSTSETVITVLPENATVNVLQKDGEWTRVGYKEHNGWCKTEYLQFNEIPPTQATEAEVSRSGLFGWLFDLF